MNRRQFLSSATASVAGAALAAPAAKPLNFVFVLMDDMGWRDLGCYGSGSFQSPNIDRLAREGMRFTNGYAACPVCSPTRASIMTGRYPARTGVTNFLPGKHQVPYSKLIAPVSRQQLELNEVTIAEMLKTKGYRSAAIGKWHMGGEGFSPRDQGFDVAFAGSQAGAPKSFFFPQWGNNPPITAKPGDYLTDVLTDEAEKFIESSKEQPFFLYLAHFGVHIPLEAKEAMVMEAKSHIKAGAAQNNAVYGAMVRSVDESVGRVMKKLADLKIADRTVLFFMSDNGGLVSAEYKGQVATSNAPLKAGKGYLYEGGIREPWIVKWPGVAKAGSRCDVPVISTDFFPTIREMAGIGNDEGHPDDGVSIVPLLKQAGNIKRDALYWHYPHYSNQGGRPGGAIRSGNYKLIEYYEDGRTELFDLKEDLGENKDISRQLPQKTAELKGKLDTWLASLKVQMPQPNPAYDKARETEGLQQPIRDQLKAGVLP